jgi:hypothetical protein
MVPENRAFILTPELALLISTSHQKFVRVFVPKS